MSTQETVNVKATHPSFNAKRTRSRSVRQLGAL
jgi:hypothetical protein